MLCFPIFLFQIWHRSNWHWYLKLEKRYLGGVPLLLQWDDKHVSTLHVIAGGGGTSGGYERLILGWQTCVSDLGTSVVVDGSQVLIRGGPFIRLTHSPKSPPSQVLVTPLRHTVIPPPMSAVRVGLEAPVAAVALLGTSAGLDGCETIAVGLSDGRLALAQSVEDDLWEETLEVGLKTREEHAWVHPGLDPVSRSWYLIYVPSREPS